RNKPVGPHRGGAPPGPGGDDDQGPSPSSRPVGGEPTVAAPADPLALPDTVKTKVGTDFDGSPPQPEGSVQRSFFPWYEERKGDYRLRLLPPLYLEHTRGLDPATGNDTPNRDKESLTAL